jgi:hypothetical protein
MTTTEPPKRETNLLMDIALWPNRLGWKRAGAHELEGWRGVLLGGQ